MRKGFTLIELMVVVVIIGILAAIAVPKFESVNDQARQASCRSNIHTFAVTEAVYFAQWGVFSDDMAALRTVQQLSPLLRCAKAPEAGEYVIALVGLDDYTVTCPGQATTMHGSVATGVTSWQ
jgi:prepilin-type N-terminal cleavage/methylation domain-containing protein